ncbi:MAG: tetratricopeptide repeat protein, partial [Bacteroidota bacterium]
LLLCLFVSALFGQSKLDRAEFYFSQGDYESAVRTINSNRNLARNNDDAALLLAVCYFQLNRLDEAEQLLKRLNEGNRANFPSAWYYLGRLFHAQHRFEEAATYYKRYLRTLPNGAEERRLTIANIRMCDNGLRHSYTPDGMVVENLGRKVNTKDDEFGPVPSPTGAARVYFSAVRPTGAITSSEEEQSDILYTELSGTEWQSPQPLHNYLMSPQHELLLDISPNGGELYYFRGSDELRGNYLVDTFQSGGVRQFTTLSLEAPISPAMGDVTPFFFSTDVIYFSGKRPGGYGGLDLYRLVRDQNGWLPPENLGPEINTPYDETTPFLAKDGRTLYYSSNNPEFTVGGFDVLKSFYLAEVGRFARPTNPGLPLNSASDDTHFRLAPDTFTAFLSSDRKDGIGRRDIYIVYFIDPRKEMEYE